jgi:hypothetical protein
MKVTLTITVEVDVAAWVETSGVDRKEAREDLRSYLQASSGNVETLWPLLADANAEFTVKTR